MSRCSARLIGSRRSTCLRDTPYVAPSQSESTPRVESYSSLNRVWRGNPSFARQLSGAATAGSSAEPAARLAVRRLDAATCVGTGCSSSDVDHRGERRDRLVAAEPHHDHALRRAAEALDVLDRHADHGAAGRDEHHLVAVADDAGAGEGALRLGELDRLHAHAAAALDRVVGDARALAVAVLGDDEQVGVVLRDVDRDHLVVRRAAACPGRRRRRGPSRAPRFSWKRIAWPSFETMRMSSSPDEWRTPTSSSPSRILIAMIPSAFSGVLYAASSVFLTTPFFVPKTRYFASSKSRVWIDRAHGLVLAERQQVDDRAALRLARAERQLVHLQPVDLADVGEEEDVVVRRGDEEVLDVVVVLQVHAHDADAAAPLLAVRGTGSRLM